MQRRVNICFCARSDSVSGDGFDYEGVTVREEVADEEIGGEGIADEGGADGRGEDAGTEAESQPKRGWGGRGGKATVHEMYCH